MKVVLLIVGGIVTWSFTSAVLWHATIPFWKWTRSHIQFPEEAEDASEAFAVFWPFALAISPLILVTIGPVIVGWKLRKKLTRVAEPKNVQDVPEQDPGPQGPKPISFTIAGVKESELLDALNLGPEEISIPFATLEEAAYFRRLLKAIDDPDV